MATDPQTDDAKLLHGQGVRPCTYGDAALTRADQGGAVAERDVEMIYY